MSTSTEQPAAPSNDDLTSVSEQLTRIREVNMKADEIRAEAGLLEAKRRLREAKRGDWFVVPIALSTMFMGGALAVAGMLIGWMLK